MSSCSFSCCFTRIAQAVGCWRPYSIILKLNSLIVPWNHNLQIAMQFKASFKGYPVSMNIFQPSYSNPANQHDQHLNIHGLHACMWLNNNDFELKFLKAEKHFCLKYTGKKILFHVRRFQWGLIGKWLQKKGKKELTSSASSLTCLSCMLGCFSGTEQCGTVETTISPGALVLS